MCGEFDMESESTYSSQDSLYLVKENNPRNWTIKFQQLKSVLQWDDKKVALLYLYFNNLLAYFFPVSSPY